MESTEDWLEEEDLYWRPEIVPQPLQWNELRKVWQYREALMLVRSAEDHGSNHALMSEAYDSLMRLSFAMMGRGPKPKLTCWRSREAKWRHDLWIWMLAWEFRQWFTRIAHKFEKSPRVGSKFGLSTLKGHGLLTNTLFRRMPRPERLVATDKYRYQVVDAALPSWNTYEEGPTKTQQEIAWRWLVLRGRHEDWEAFRESLPFRALW